MPGLHMAWAELAIVRPITVAVIIRLIAQETLHAKVFEARVHVRFEPE